MFRLFGLLLVGLVLSAKLAVANVLPNVSVEEQYRFALSKAIQNDLVAAEKAFEEFNRKNSGHSRYADSLFWLGRIQFMRGRYEKAAMTFVDFGTASPDDPRLLKTVIWIAEAVSQFATPDDACKVYANLPSFINNPTRDWLQQLATFASDMNCNNKIIASLGGTPNKKTLNDKKSASAEMEAERYKRIQLEQELEALKAQQEQQQQTISYDTQIPLITITLKGVDGRKGTVKGYAKDNVQIAEVLIDGQPVQLGSNGSFEWSGFVPATGKEITIEAIDTAALSSTKTVSLKRRKIQQASGPRFDDLDPTSGKRVKRNDNALALIVGIADYERTDAPAIYADRDAQFFHDYASLKLGIPDSNITTMVNDKAEQGDVILAVKEWMRRSSKPGKSDVYVFFAGHGLASQDGEEMYLLPYDGRPRLLEDSAISRERLFADISAANPRSVTVFLDTCYSGTTRGTDMLIASRPIAIKALKQSVPDNFTVMTAAAGDQTAKPLEEAKHGMFSYFLMKGMEGEADANNDNEITAGELHSYVQTNVIQQSSGSQTPELQGDADRVLVRFQ
jgi:tetratricopeptide (TPR) repeat protein